MTLRERISVLELDTISRRFGEVTALDGLSFAVQPGELCGFVGANGAGKTTAMRIIMGVDRPGSGEVRWQGEPLDRERRRSFGYMPEERGLYPKMKVTDQLVYLASLHGLPRKPTASVATQWLERLGLGARVDDRLEELSLGNQQRVQLVAALIHDPQLLVLDEPFSGIDPVALETMSEVVVDYAAERGAPILLSSHQLDLVERLCDSVVIIDDGRLVAAGGVEELRQQGQERDRRLRVQVADPRDDGWAGRVGGVTLVAQEWRGELQQTVLRMEHAGGAARAREAVLDAARETGALVGFEEVRPSLTDLYREAVVRDGTAQDDAPDLGGRARR